MRFKRAKIVLLRGSVILLGLAAANGSFADINPKTIVGAWLFDEGAGNETKDQSAMALHGKATGGPKWVAGAFGKALEFDGKGSYVTIPEHENPVDAITVSAWVKSATPTWNQHGFIVEKRDAFIIHPVANEINVGWCFSNPGPWNQPMQWDSGKKGPPDGDITKWHMYTGTFDSKTGEWNLFVDAVSVSKLALNKSPLMLEKGPIHIGYDECCDFNRFGAATIDEVIILNVALGAADLKTLMNGYDAALSVKSAGKLATQWGTLKERR